MEIKVERKGKCYTLGLPERKRTVKQALQASIDKWTVIAALGNSGMIEHSNDRVSCGLCQKFNTAYGCTGCPVAKKTGKDFCEDTPYEKWVNEKSRANALKELNFLKSLKV